MPSPGSTASPRLLTNLLSHERDYAKALNGLVDAGGAACTALVLYQPWLNDQPQQGGSELGHGQSAIYYLALADAGLRHYTAAVETYVEGLKELRDLEENIRNLIRDREILVTRVLKVSNKSSNRESIFMTVSPSHSAISLDSFSGKSYSKYGGGKDSKLPHWQAELHGCETQLASAQRDLEVKRVSAIRDGLRLRATAMVECGNRWAEAGKAILQLNADGPPLPPLPDINVHFSKPLPDDMSSLTPSQSASQTDADIDDLHIPPAHAIADLGLPTSVPHVLSRRITEEDLDANNDSSSGDEDDLNVVENPRFNSKTSTKRSRTSSEAPQMTASPRDGSPSRSRFFGSIRGLFGHKKTSSVNGDADDALDDKLPKPRKTRTWDTRTDKNIRKVDPVIATPSPSANELSDSSTPRAKRLRKVEPEKRTRRRSASMDGHLPQASDSAVWQGPVPSPSPSPTKQRTKKTKQGTGSHDLSRNDSISSAPPTFSAHTTSSPPPAPLVPSAHQTTSQQKRQNSQPLTTSKTERRVSSPAPSTSLMSIVEDVTRTNRQATVAVESRGRDRTLSGGFVPIKAPQSLSRKEIEGLPMDSLLEGERQRTLSSSSSRSKLPRPDTLFDVKAPSSVTRENVDGLPVGSTVIASSTPPHSPRSSNPSITVSSAPPASQYESALPPSRSVHSPSSDASHPSSSSSSGSASRPALLRSALRNGGSRTPSPLSPVGRAPSPPVSNIPNLLVVHAPSPLHAVNGSSQVTLVDKARSGSGVKSLSPPNVASLPPKTTSMPPTLQSSSPQAQFITRTSSKDLVPPSMEEEANFSDGDDTASVQSFRTTNEVFADDDDPTPKPVRSPSPPGKDVAHAPNGNAVHNQNGTDLSASSDSTVATTPKRRKSVRVSLRPTFSATPPAIEYDESEWHTSDNTAVGEENGNAKKRTWKDDEPPDMWQDSSDEDEQYSAARKLLSRVARKEKKAKARG